MKLIKKEQKTPELIWGNKYRLLEDTGDLDKGTVVVLVRIDPDGDIKVISESDWDFVDCDQLQEINQETLEPLETENKQLTVELTEDELRVIKLCVGSTSPNVIRDKAKMPINFGIVGDAGHIGESIYSSISEILYQGDK